MSYKKKLLKNGKINKIETKIWSWILLKLLQVVLRNRIWIQIEFCRNRIRGVGRCKRKRVLWALLKVKLINQLLQLHLRLKILLTFSNLKIKMILLELKIVKELFKVVLNNLYHECGMPTQQQHRRTVL